MKKIILMAIILASHICYAQTKPKSNVEGQVNYSALKVGEKVPNIVLGEIVNYGNALPKDKKSVKISDFKGKLLILDFWSVGCGSCIAAFPKLEKLQEYFSEEILILPVGFDIIRENGEIWKGGVPSLIKRWKNTPKEMKLPCTRVAEPVMRQNSQLRQLFPFQTTPTILWIDRNGVFRGSTGGDALTKENIQKVVNDDKLFFKQKILLSSVEPSNFLIKQFDKKNNPVFGSVFSKRIDALRSVQFQLDADEKGYFHFYAVNNPVDFIYRIAYRNLFEKEKWNGNVIVDADSKPFYKTLVEIGRLDYWKKDSVYADNMFCYEAIYPRANYSVTEAWTQAIKDVDNYLDVQSGIEIREVVCLNLVKMNQDEIPIAFSRKLSTVEIEGLSNEQFWMHNEIDYFVSNLQSKAITSFDLPVIINQTGYNGQIGVLFNEEDFKNLKSIKATLRKNGLDLVAGKSKMNVLVLKRR